jgi:sterol desaturase/sphingolipid hydroxylase (fatty acid hydroxylase superfamily)
MQFAFLPMALFFSPALFLVHYQLNLLGQFWVHTQTIKKLPWIVEAIITTPSHHRVHHGNVYITPFIYPLSVHIFTDKHEGK